MVAIAIPVIPIGINNSKLIIFPVINIGFKIILRKKLKIKTFL